MSRAPAAGLLTSEEQTTFQLWSRPGSTEPRLRQRARILLQASEGHATKEIAKQFRTRFAKWRGRFAKERLAGLRDKARPGRPEPLRYPKNTGERVLAQLNEPPPESHGRWTGPLLAQRLGDVKDHKVWQVLRRGKISLAQRHSWRDSTGPEFAAKAADVVGLPLRPPENAVVLRVDEKPRIQALERAQGWLRMPDRKALGGLSQEYKRHGTATLLAAMEVATGLVKACPFGRPRRREFLQLMNHLVALYPDREPHVVLHNLNTRKPRENPGSRGIPRSFSTTRRRTGRGSTKWRCGSAS